jgi:fluoroquinolone resistance protein
MTNEYIEGKNFEKEDYTILALPKGEYENCTFLQCNFSNTDLSNIFFIECKFINCNLSLATLNNTAFREIDFTDCKLLGLHFENCNEFLFSVGFTNCNLNLCSFYQRKMKKSLFRNASFHEVDFTETDISGSVFESCDLSGAVFSNTNLEKADFSTAVNYSIDPNMNKIRKAKFGISGVSGLLDKYDIEIL